METQRETLAGRLGFILLSAGCAIGIGNVWRFPYVAGESGGGWFVLIYLACLALVGVPMLTMEFAAGRASRRSIAKLHDALTPAKKAWRLHGVAGMVGLVALMSFYVVVSGWMLIYFWKCAVGGFAGLDVSQVGGEFKSMFADWRTQSAVAAGVSVCSAATCAAGLRNGVERATKWMMAALFVLIVVLAVHSVMLPGAWRGVEFYLFPDFARTRAAGVWTVAANAMNQAFFTLSLGIGSMAIFGSYVGRERTLLGEAVNVAALDTFVAVCAGLIVIPACFAFGVEPAQGPGLVFVTLPNVFNHMAGGRFWGALFFLFMGCAALTTVLAVFEGIVAGVRDWFGCGRGAACLALAVALPLLSLPCVFGFNLWSGFRPFGAGSNVLDLEDFVVSDLLLPFGGVAFAFYCCWRFGWGWEKFVAEANAGRGPRVPNFLRGYCAYVLPAVVAAIAVGGLVRRFS